MRWMEEFELKHAEFIRCIKTFDTMRTAWENVAANCTHRGYAAFARRQSVMYRDLHKDAEDLYQQRAEKQFSGISGSETLIREVHKFRESELGWLTRLVGQNT